MTSYYGGDEPTNTVDIPTIIAANVEWHHGYGNHPSLILMVNEAWRFPNPYSTWEHRLLEKTPGGRLYFATKDIFAHYVCVPYEQRKDSGVGCGGHTGNLLLEDGHTLRVTDGWSSRAGVINLFLDPADHIVDVTLIERHPGIGRHGIAVRKDALGDFLPDGIHLVNEGIEPCYTPSTDRLKVKKP